MSVTSISHEWPVGSDDGKHVWVQAPDGRFDGIRTEVGILKLGVHDLDLYGLSAGPSCRDSACATFYPADFKFCPNCGHPLERLGGAVGHGPNNGPMAHGERTPIKISASKAEEVPLPPGRLFAGLGLADVPGVMVLARQETVLWRFSQSLNKWVEVAGGMPSAVDFRPGSWTFAATKSALAFPTDGSLEVFRHVQGRLEHHSQFLMGGRAVGGAVLLAADSFADHGIFAVPVVLGDVLHVALRGAEPGAEWHMKQVDGAPGGLTRLGRPVFGSSYFWATEDGFLSVRNAVDPAVQWNAFEGKFTGLPDHPTLILPREKIPYQFGILNGRTFGFHQFAFQGNVAECHAVDGAVLCAGNMCFKVRHRFMRAPWHPDHIEDVQVPAAENDFVYPVSSISANQAIVALVAGRSHLSALAQGERLSPGLRAEICLIDGTCPPQSLGMISYVRSMGQLSAIISEGYLWVYDQSANRMSRWPLDRC